jgi:hypothetical protein
MGEPTAEWPARPDDPRPPSRSRARWGGRWRWVAAGAGVLLLLAVLMPSPLVEWAVDRAAARYQGECTEFVGLSVSDSGSWPTVVRAAAGKLRDVAVHADEVRFSNDFTIYDVDLTAEQVNVAALRFGLTDDDAIVEGGRSTALVRLDDLEAIIADWGVDLTLRGLPAGEDATGADTGPDSGDGSGSGGSGSGVSNTLAADVEVPVIGTVPTTVEVAIVDGDLELRFVALDVIPLPSVTIELPNPVTLESLEVGPDSVRVATTIDGTIASGDWACDTSTSATGA